MLQHPFHDLKVKIVQVLRLSAHGVRIWRKILRRPVKKSSARAGKCQNTPSQFSGSCPSLLCFGDRKLGQELGLIRFEPCSFLPQNTNSDPQGLSQEFWAKESVNDPNLEEGIRWRGKRHKVTHRKHQWGWRYTKQTKQGQKAISTHKNPWYFQGQIHSRFVCCSLNPQ